MRSILGDTIRMAIVCLGKPQCSISAYLADSLLYLIAHNPNYQGILTLRMAPEVSGHSSPLLDGQRFKLKPFLQRRDITKRFRIKLSGDPNPIYGHAACHRVDAHALMRVPRHGWRYFPEPLHGSLPHSNVRDKSAFPGGNLKRFQIQIAAREGGFVADVGMGEGTVQ